MILKEISAFLLLIFAQRSLLIAQTSAQAGQIPRWPEINLNALVVDKSGQPQVPLDKSTLRVYEDGVERPLKSITAGDAPVSLALLIDTSGSMREKRASVAEVAAAIIRAMPPGSEVMAVLFNVQPYFYLPFTSTDPAPLSFLNRQDFRDGTVLYDSIALTEGYISKNARYATRALVVLSDGEDDASRSSLPDAVRSLLWPGAPTVYFALLPNPDSGYNEKRHSKLAAEILVSAGGGLSLVADKKQVPAALGAKIAALIRSQYVLAFTTADPAPNGMNHKVEVRLAGQTVKVRICAMPSYFAPRE